MTKTIVRRRQRPLIVGLFVVLFLGVTVLCPAVALAKHKPILSGVGLAPAAFYGGAGSSGSTTLTYTLHLPAQVSVIVRDADGVTVRTLQPDTPQTAGTYTLDWDGTDGEGKTLGAGTYALEVTARSGNGTVRSTRTVELLAPLLADVSVAPPSFYGGAGSTTLTYTLSAAATTSVIVRDADNVTVRTLQPDTPQTAGTYTLDWDGTADDASPLAPGSYSIVVSAGNWIGSAQSAQDVELMAPVLTDVGVAPASFYFGVGSTTVSYTLAVAADVSVIVRDAEDATVRTLQVNTTQTAGTYTLDWDGTADDASPLAPGSYSIVVTATTAIGTMQSTQDVELLAPLLADVGLAPALFYLGAGSTTLTYTLGEAATVSVLVHREHGAAIVRTLQPDTLQAPGTYALDWDGTDGEGTPLGAGIYRLVVTATTAAGSAESTQTVELLAPLLTDVSVAPTSFYGGAGSGGSTTFSYTLTDEATTSVIVRDADGAIVRTLQPDTLQAPGTYALDWDGTDGYGATLPAGIYRLVVNASTSAGSAQSTQTVELLAPLLADVGLAPTSFYGGAGSSGSTTLTYTLSAAADASVIVRDADGVTVRTLQPDTLLAAGTYAFDWDGTDGEGATLPAGSYRLVVTASTSAGSAQSTQDVLYAPTPVASAASLALDATGDYVLRAVVENWSETLNGQTAANYFYDGKAQPWEYAATSGATLTLYVGVDPADQEDTTGGGVVSGTSDARA